jgi:hypothetical protein
VSDHYPRPGREAARWLGRQAVFCLVFLTTITALCYAFGLGMEWLFDWHQTTPARAAASTGFAIAFTRLWQDYLPSNLSKEDK